LDADLKVAQAEFFDVFQATLAAFTDKPKFDQAVITPDFTALVLVAK
jgi:hypothetical protein